MTMLDAPAAPLSADARAFVLLKSGRRLDLLNPDPQAWTDGDHAASLSRTARPMRLLHAWNKASLKQCDDCRSTVRVKR
jgi:hypothetical protein